MAGISLNRVGGTTGWHITPENAQNLVDAFNAAARLGCECHCSAVPSGPDPSAPGLYIVQWSFNLTPHGETTKSGGIGDWIVYEAGTARLYRWPDMPSTFTTEEVPLDWAATMSAPILEALPGLTARLTFPQPTSPNGPFNYTFSGGTPGADPAPITPISRPVVNADGNLFAEFTGLSEGAQYDAVVTVTTPYPDITATSVTSNTITAGS